MDYEKCVCPVLKVDGLIATGKQYDLEITLPEDNRTVIYGIVKDCYKDPVSDAVVKLVEVDKKYDKEERKPVSHTFTDKNGEFVFGPLCANRLYEIEIWADEVKHCKVCASCKHEGKCLKGVELDCDKKDDKYYDKHEDKCYDKKPCDYDKHEDKSYDKDEDKKDDKYDDKHDKDHK